MIPLKTPANHEVLVSSFFLSFGLKYTSSYSVTSGVECKPAVLDISSHLAVNIYVSLMLRHKLESIKVEINGISKYQVCEQRGSQ